MWLVLLAIAAIVAPAFMYFFPLIIVEHESMLPTLKPKQIILGRRIIHVRRVTPQGVYIVKLPWDKRKFVKRVCYCTDKNRQIFVMGDNRNVSWDSRSFGWISWDCIIAKIILPRHLENRKEQ